MNDALNNDDVEFLEILQEPFLCVDHAHMCTIATSKPEVEGASRFNSTKIFKIPSLLLDHIVQYPTYIIVNMG